jgi:hypothetical protein
LSLLQDKKKYAYFCQFGIHKSFNQAVKYLAVGIAEHCDLFLDMSLIQFIADAHHTVDCFSLITQLLSYFPQESRLLNYFFNQTLTFPSINFNPRFLLFQVYQVKSLRESSSSTELALKLGEMKTLAKIGISTSKKFWSNPNVHLSFLYHIKIYTDKIKSLYNELINKYQNNVRLYEDYSYFLIEGATDFSKALQIKHQCNLLKAGSSFAVDSSFRSLIKSFPAYLKRQILDFKGNFIKNELKPNKKSILSSPLQSSFSQLSETKCQ